MTKELPVDYPILYVIVRNDLDSMNSGKAEAHSGHAVSSFVVKKCFPTHLKSKTHNNGVCGIIRKWLTSTPQGFGTQINLNGSLEDIDDIVSYLESVKCNDVLFDIIKDPTYPRVNKINGNLELRSVDTAMYIFGMKSNPILQKCVSHLDLK